MTPTQIITIRAPEFASDSRLSDLITLAGEQTGTVFGNQRNMAIALLVMHWLTLEKSGGVSGAIISEKEGDLARSYAKPVSDDILASTSFGAELLTLRKANIFGPRTRTME